MKNPSVEWAKEQGSKELKNKINQTEDLALILNCEPTQIATNTEEISPDTKAYIGPWSVAAHHALPTTCEHVYNQTFENKVFRRTIELTTRTNEEYLEALDAQGMQIRDWTRDNILLNLTPLAKKESVNLVSFSVSNLGLSDGVTLKQIYAKANELGLDLCDPHVGPEMRLAFKDQPANSFYRIAMKPVIKPGGREVVFGVDRLGDDVLWLDRDGGDTDGTWYANHVFVFSSRTV